MNQMVEAESEDDLGGRDLDRLPQEDEQGMEVGSPTTASSEPSLAPLLDGQLDMSEATGSGDGTQEEHAAPARGRPGSRTGLEDMEQPYDEHVMRDEEADCVMQVQDGGGAQDRLGSHESPEQPADVHGSALHGQREEGSQVRAPQEEAALHEGDGRGPHPQPDGGHGTALCAQLEDGAGLPEQPDEGRGAVLHGQDTGLPGQATELPEEQARGHESGEDDGEALHCGPGARDRVDSLQLAELSAEVHGPALHGQREEVSEVPAPHDGAGLHEGDDHDLRARPDEGDGTALPAQLEDGPELPERPDEGHRTVLHGQQDGLDSGDEDCVVLMAWGSGIPPWRRTYTARDRWLKQNNDEGWHRRRQREWKRDHWRGSSPSRTKGKGKKKDKVDKRAGPKAKARPYSVWSASGRKEVQAEDIEEDDEDEVEK